MLNQSAVRQGWITVHTDDHGKLVLRGIPVLGWDKGLPTNRTLHISREAPAWFKAWCYRKADTGYEIRVMVNALHGGQKAYAGPVLMEEAQALDEAQQRAHAKASVGGRVVEDFNQARQAHEYMAILSGLTLTAHHGLAMAMYSVATDPHDQQQYRLSGGAIVAKLKINPLTQSELWEQEVKKFVRIRTLKQKETT